MGLSNEEKEDRVYKMILRLMEMNDGVQKNGNGIRHIFKENINLQVHVLKLNKNNIVSRGVPAIT